METRARTKVRMKQNDCSEKLNLLNHALSNHLTLKFGKEIIKIKNVILNSIRVVYCVNKLLLLCWEHAS